MSGAELRAQAHALLERVLELDARDREAVLADACAGNPALRALVDGLLAADADTATLLGAGPEQLMALLTEDESGDHAGLPYDGQIGDYHLIAEAGRGGMATVYLAERERGAVRQRVALKLVRRGIDTDEVLRRFAHESRVLASLEHPGIARFLDVGVSPDGRPYLVMEFIEGVALTAYCDRARLGISGRLRLFQTVCDAVQYAHQRLVVHRDIKPSNVLVTQNGAVKLLDFGIAKLLDEEHDGDNPQTRTGLLLLTPEYAAPEQITGGQVSTATDVYALGLMLYELLAGCRPRDALPLPAIMPAAGTAAAPLEPPAPSTAVRRATRDGSAEKVAAARGIQPERLRRKLEGDLDRIVLKALEHEPARRYQTAQQLAEEIERHLTGLPVLARPATVTYRLRKYARRHRVGVAVTAMTVFLLAGFTGFHTARITRERDRARGEAEKAEATSRFLQQLIGDAYPSVALGDTFSMSDLLSRAVLRVDSLSAQPEVQAELLRTLGDVYREQGHFDEALPLLERAVAVNRRTRQPISRAAGHALSALGHLHQERKDYAAALRAHRESLDVFEQLVAHDDTLVLFALNNMAVAAADMNDFEEALRLYHEVIARAPRMFDDTSQLVHTTHNNLGNLYDRSGRPEDAERELRTALRLRRAGLPADHPSIALTLNNLASVLHGMQRLDEAEKMHREALAMFRRVFGPDHYRVGLSAYNLARVRHAQGGFAEADSLYRLTLAIDRRTYGPEHLEVAADLRRLGELQRDGNDCGTAMQTFAQADAIYAKNELPQTDRRRLNVRAATGACLTALGRFREAEETLLGAYRAARAAEIAVDSTALRHTIESLATLYESWGRAGEAEPFRALLQGGGR